MAPYPRKLPPPIASKRDETRLFVGKSVDYDSVMTEGFAAEVTIVLPRDGGLALQSVVRSVRREHPSIAVLETESAIHIVSDHHSAQSLAALWMRAAATQAALKPSDGRCELTTGLLSESKETPLPGNGRIYCARRKRFG